MCNLAVGCRMGEFVCSNQKCIHFNRTCNGDNNCGDGSDEELAYCNQGIYNKTRLDYILKDFTCHE